VLAWRTQEVLPLLETDCDVQGSRHLIPRVGRASGWPFSTASARSPGAAMTVPAVEALAPLSRFPGIPAGPPGEGFPLQLSFRVDKLHAATCRRASRSAASLAREPRVSGGRRIARRALGESIP